MKKRIIFRSGSLRMGGLERILIEVLQNIDKEKYNITLVIDDDCGKRNVFEKDIPKEIPYYFLKPYNLIKQTEYYKERKKNLFCKLMYNLYMNFENFIMYRNMRKILKELGNIDILIDFDAGAAKYIGKLDVHKKVVWIHNSIPKLKKKKSKIERFGKRLEKYDKVVAICDEMKEELKEIYPKIANKVIRIYNSFDFENIIFKANDFSSLCIEEKKLIKEKYILSVSRLDEVQKDFKTLLKSFSELNNREYKLYIIGDGPDRNKIDKMIESLNLKDRVCLLGRKKNPYIWMKNAEIFVHSSKYEGFCLVILEALILGKAVVSSNCKVGPKEILLDGKYGELFEVGNSEELKIKMEKLIKDQNLKKKYEKLSKEAIERFNIKKVILNIEDVLVNE